MALGSSRLNDTFGVFEDANYRWYWVGSFCYYTGFWMDLLVMGWLAYELTHSAAQLGYVVVSQGFPMAVLSVVGGTLADRVPKRAVILIAQVVLAANAALLFLLLVTDTIQYWHLVVLTLLNGAAVGLSLPGRLAFISEIVSDDQFVRAYGMYYVALNFMRIGGPAVGGIAIATVGAEGAYGIIAVSHGIAVLFLLPVRSRLATFIRPITTFWQDMGGLFALAWSSSTILVLMGAQLGITFFVFSAMTLLPVFADRMYGVDATGLGALQAASGAGGLAGSLAVAAFSRTERKALMLLLAGMAQGLVLMAFAAASSFGLGLAFIAGVGFAQAVYTTLNSTLFQTSAPSDMRGRAMSLYLLGGALQPLAVAPLSVAADAYGVQPTVLVAGGLLIVYTAVVAVAFPRFRTMRS